MISFVISLTALVFGYLIYGRIVERIIAPDDRPTPAVAQADGVDYIVLPSWKVFMIQFLNIAGTGPIFGAIMGAKFGPAAYLWIVFGCIFAGAVHDYFCGMLSMRHKGASLPELVGIYLGIPAKKILLVFSIIVLLMVGTVFVYSPALILGGMTAPNVDAKTFHIMIWVAIIFAYYVLANMSSTPNLDGSAIFPCLFITIACGAVSGFHATQSPLMARCIKSEKSGRSVFYGAMITEGIVALVWATVSSYFFYDGGAATVDSTTAAQAPEVVTAVSKGWLGFIGGILAILGVVAAPITSGDTAFRSARLIIADFFKISQRPIINRLFVAAPLFVAASFLLWFNIADKDGFNVIWRYFGWSNQTLAVFTLWTATVYLAREQKPYVLALIPALFMTIVCTTFICYSNTMLNLSLTTSYIIGGITFAITLIWFFLWQKRYKTAIKE